MYISKQVLISLMKILNKDFICKISLSIFAVALSFIFLEISTRFWLYSKSLKSFEKVMSNLPELKSNVPVTLGDIISPSKYPGIIYDLRPNIKVSFMNEQLETNAQGWRGKLYPIHKDKNTIRIVTLGDSHMFGWGVPQDKRYSNVLEKMLNSRFTEKKWEIVNSAVPGYNTYMEVETLKIKAIIYSPDIVIIEYIGNDLDLPNFIMENTDYLNFRKSFFVNFLKGRTGLLNTKLNLIGAPTWLALGGERFVGEYEISLVPEKYQHMVGWESFAKSMEKLKKMQQEHHFDVVICISHSWPEFIAQKIINLCSHLRFHVLFRPLNVSPSLILSREDLHPSALAHRDIADSLFVFMVQEKIIKKYVEK